ncbi:hypothetical protein B4U79_15187 [Dinothrombium tinctorium]|uniref:Uncharacterized protein n=1 Tax=Dinothrombium tinctorium TaxID=1965070 RepID=A0A3S3P5L2_9ACAR|nr:hypothetical protein B4U79_15187 [Dinothrombium tinctorium]
MFAFLRKIYQKMAHWYLIYELTSSLYMLEPWERYLFSEYRASFLSNQKHTCLKRSSKLNLLAYAFPHFVSINAWS